MGRKGFSLIESLISLSICFFIVICSLEFYVSVRSHFLKLKEEEETNAEAFAALDKMRIDFMEGGLGLTIPIKQGILDGIREVDGTLSIFSKEHSYSLSQSIVPGQTRIILNNTEGFKKYRDICISDKGHGEIHTISSVDEYSIVLSSPINLFYAQKDTQIILIKKVIYFLDQDQNVLRRKVNSSPAQPLLEHVSSFEPSYEKASNLVRISLVLKTTKEKKYEISVFPKNIALAFFL